MLYANLAARQLFGDGQKLEGLAFDELLERRAAGHARGTGRGAAIRCSRSKLHGEPQVFHLSQRRFLLNGQPHRLRLLKQLTREFNAREVATWKRVIRVIAHEINNSVAPIASLAQSGQRLAEQPDRAQLQRVFAAIEERMAHLAGFVEGYSRFAKLPRPRPETVDWHVVHRAAAHGRAVQVEGALPDEPALVRCIAAPAGAAEPAQERARGGLASRRDPPRGRANGAMAGCSRFATAARA